MNTSKRANFKKTKRGKDIQSSDEASNFSESENDKEAQVKYPNLFNPIIDSITEYNQESNEYCVKFKDRSYHHVKWMLESTILNNYKNGKSKIRKFHTDTDEGKETYDASYVEVDRVLNSSEFFSVIHPHQATLIENSWKSPLVTIMLKLINYRKDYVCYGIPFLELDEPEDYPLYFKSVRSPMDFSSILNKLYMGNYAAPEQYWRDLGMVFKNAQNFYSDSRSDIRVVCDTLRQIAVFLYRSWWEQVQRPVNLSWIVTVPGVDVLSPDFIYAPDGVSDVDYLQFKFLKDPELQAISDMVETDRIYFVKWKNLSYKQCTWEPESILNCPQKLADFYRFNKAMDGESRRNLVKLQNAYSRCIEIGKLSDNRQKSSRTALAMALQQIDFPTCTFQGKVTPLQSKAFRQGLALRDYQISSTNWMIQNWHDKRNFILADEMGLGKTIQIIALFNHLISHYKCRGPYLVIAPLTTLQHWKNTVDDWTFQNAVIYYDQQGQDGRALCYEHEFYYTDILKRGRLSKKSKLIKFNILITSYEIFMTDYDKIMKIIPWQYIVIDEAHRLKNKNARMLHMLKDLPQKRFALLTGTPLQNNTEELWTLLNFIEPDCFPALEQFLLEYGKIETKEQVDELQKMLKKYLLRRMKEDVEQDIPPLQETVIDVELTAMQKAYYKIVFERNRNILIKGINAANIPVLNNIEIQLRKVCNHPYQIKSIQENHENEDDDEEAKFNKMVDASGKMVLLNKLLPKLKEEGRRVLIFSQFTMMLDIIQDYLIHKKFVFERIDGQVKQCYRQGAIDRFNEEESQVDVFLLSTRAGGLGINLTKARVVIIFDSDWNPQNDIQATARAHRIGQTQEVQVYRLITARTYESSMFERASKKLGLDQAIFSGKFLDKKTANDKEAKKEIERILRDGAYAILDEDPSKSEQFLESNIEDILTKNSRVIDYNIVRGNYNLNKSTFVSQNADTSLNIDDPHFWEKLMPKQDSELDYLQTRLNSNSINIKENEALFMKDLTRMVEDFRISKGKTGKDTFGNLGEEDMLQSILVQVGQTRQFEHKHRQLANQMLSELEKPLESRRIPRVKRISLREDVNSDDEIFGEHQEEEEEEEEIPQTRTRITIPKKSSKRTKASKISRADKDSNTFGGTGYLCTHCEREGCSWFCTKMCRRAWHSDCKDKPLNARKDFTIPENEERKTREILKRIDESWAWSDCNKGQAQCFMCKNYGNYKLPGANVDPSRQILGWYLASCGKAYHYACLQTVPWLNTRGKILCPRHICKGCDLAFKSSKAVNHCTRCINSYHNECLPDNALLLNNRFILCNEHEQPNAIPVYPPVTRELRKQLKKGAGKIKHKLNQLSADYKDLAAISDGKKKSKSTNGDEPRKQVRLNFNGSNPKN